jgi:hypothetical protein
MVVFNANESDISFVTVEYRSVLVISFIFYTAGIFLMEHDEIKW